LGLPDPGGARPPIRQSFPPAGIFEDPRPIKEYVDLDAPIEAAPGIDYRTVIDYGDLEVAATSSAESATDNHTADSAAQIS